MEIDRILADFFVRQPSGKAARALARQLLELFTLITREVLPYAGRGERVSLERLADAAREAGIASGMLARKGTLDNIDQLSYIHEKLLRLKNHLAAFR